MADQWTDVAALAVGGFLDTTSLAGQQRIGGAVVPVPTDFLRYPRIAVSVGGKVAVIGQGGEGDAWLIVGGHAASLGTTFGMFPVAVRFEGEELITYRVVPGDFAPLLVNGVEAMRMFSVEGIRDVHPDGTIIKGIDTASAVIQGRPFGQYTERDGWVVGQSGFSIGCLQVATGHYFTARRGTMAEGIHFALQGSTLAVCALTEAGGYYQTFAAPYPPHEPLTEPEPEPEPEPMPDPIVPQSEQDRAQAMLATVRAETGFGPNQPPLPYVQLTAQRLAGKWGLNGKRGDANDPSGDILAYDFPGQQPQLYDVLQDAGGANNPAWQPLEYPQAAGAVWLPPRDAPTDPGEPNPDPDLEARVTALEGQVRALDKRVTALEQGTPGTLPAAVAVTVVVGDTTYRGTATAVR